MKKSDCTEIAISNYKNNPIFVEVINTLQRQLIDKGIMCTTINVDHQKQPETFYIFFNEHQNPNFIDVSIKYAIFNYEQAGSSYLQYQNYLIKMASGIVIFDYSEYNKNNLQKLINKDVIVVPFIYHPSLTVLKPSIANRESVDIIFYGLMNSNRQKYYDVLKDHFNVRFSTNLFGDALYEAWKDVKIILNLHYFLHPSVLELSRIVPAIANYKLVLSERSDDTIADQRFEDMVVFIDETNILQECRKYLENPNLRNRRISQAFKILSSETF